MNRRLILVDIENFNGGPVATVTQSTWCYRMLSNWLSFSDSDHIVVASDVTTVTNLCKDWGHHRVLAGRGHNGADLQLLEVLEESVEARYSEILLVSGDAIYSDKVSYLAGQGIPTTVYSHACALAKRLQFAATTVVTSPTTQEPDTFGKAA
ncbi:NYN domain-containing protein [Corynebacterium aquilae]|uniref:NYN domain-containing protein n=1 Tax=Corynebacterium aquilae TaxID=203263 RepID=UPI000951F0AA|nr:NYN domain-containing protein [Corynebacterium aquilae]